MSPWMIYALLGAVAAASVSLLGKKGMEHIPPTAATTVRSLVMTLFLLLVTLGQGQLSAMKQVRGPALWLVALSGIGGAVSWLFMFKALSLADVRQVMPIDKLSLPLGILLAAILLGERPSYLNWAGVALMTGGAVLATWKA